MTAHRSDTPPALGAAPSPPTEDGSQALEGSIPRTARILLVDDEPVNVHLLERILARSNYARVTSTTDPTRVLALYDDLQPDLILLDLHMPPPDGLTLLRQLRALIPGDDHRPILILTADTTLAAKQRALALGATDFLTKPLDAVEVVLRIRNLLETRFLHRRLHNENGVLEDRVRARTREVEQAGIEVLERLALAAEYRDDDTGQHTQRVARTAALVAHTLGLTEDQVDLIRRAAPLHDVGKIGVPDGILLKPSALAPEERERMETHTVIGARILSGSQFTLLRLAEEIAHSHHERWDGGGYPRGLRGEDIPLAGRIVAVADVFDALTHRRPYKGAWTVAEALTEVERQSGGQFDPRVAESFLASLRSGDALPTARASRVLTEP